MFFFFFLNDPFHSLWQLYLCNSIHYQHNCTNEKSVMCVFHVDLLLQILSLSVYFICSYLFQIIIICLVFFFNVMRFLILYRILFYSIVFQFFWDFSQRFHIWAIPPIINLGFEPAQLSESIIHSPLTLLKPLPKHVFRQKTAISPAPQCFIIPLNFFIWKLRFF